MSHIITPLAFTEAAVEAMERMERARRGGIGLILGPNDAPGVLAVLAAPAELIELHRITSHRNEFLVLATRWPRRDTPGRYWNGSRRDVMGVWRALHNVLVYDWACTDTAWLGPQNDQVVRASIQTAMLLDEFAMPCQGAA